MISPKKKEILPSSTQVTSLSLLKRSKILKKSQFKHFQCHKDMEAHWQMMQIITKSIMEICLHLISACLNKMHWNKWNRKRRLIKNKIMKKKTHLTYSLEVHRKRRRTVISRVKVQRKNKNLSAVEDNKSSFKYQCTHSSSKVLFHSSHLSRSNHLA